MRQAVDTVVDVVTLIGLVWLLPIVILLIGLRLVLMVRVIAGAIKLLLR